MAATVSTSAAPAVSNDSVPTPVVSAPAAAPATFQSASLYVGDLLKDVSEPVLFEEFSRVGPVASIRVCRDTLTRQSLGYAYVNFHNVDDADRALTTMQFIEIKGTNSPKGKPCRIMWSQRDASLRRSGVGNTFVNNLAKTVDQKDLFDLFSAFGNILSCKIAQNEAGESKGYAYVHFETAKSSEDAIAKLNGASLEGLEMSVTPFVRVQDRTPAQEWTNVYVRVPDTYTKEQLAALLTPFGPLASVAISPNQEGKTKAFPTNFGFANFADHASALRALNELNGKTIENVNAPGTTFEVYVSKAQKKTERTREIKAKVTALDMERTAKWTGMNLFVKNLDESITDEVLNETFAKFGTITSAKIVRDETVPGSPSKGFGYVCFSSPEEATLAVSKLNGMILRSKPITVALHQTKAQRDAHLSATSRYGGMPRFPPGPQNMQFMQNMYMPQGAGQFNGNRMPGGPGQANFQYANFPPGSRGQQGRGGQQGGYGGMPQPYNAYNMGPSMGPGLRRGIPLNNNVPNNNRLQNRPNTGARGGPPMNGNRQSMMPPNMMPAPRQGVPQAGYQRNMMRPDQVMMMPPPQQMQQPMPVVNNNDSSAPLDDHALAAADPQEQKNMIGERLYPLIYRHQPSKSGKITGMLLEMDNAELLHLIDTPDALLSKIEEALTVLKHHESGMPHEAN